MSRNTLPRDTMHALLKNYEQRLNVLEARGRYRPSGLLTVATIGDVDDLDPDTGVYAIDTELVYYQGGTMTLAAWNALW